MILDGELEVVIFDGDFCEEQKYDGELNEVTNISTVPEYQGAYEVTPSEFGQVLMTSGFRMEDNVVIGAIPQNYGLLTWDGSTLRVS